MLIGEVARKTGIPASTLRYYESIGLLPAPPKINQQRRYDQAILLQVEAIKIARQAGFTLAEIKALYSQFEEQDSLSDRWQTMADDKMKALGDLEEQIQRMKQVLTMGLACKCQTLETCKLLQAD